MGKRTAAEIAVALEGLPAWQVLDGKLHREFQFRDFSEAFAFMTRVALLAEKADHHPDWTNAYDRVVIDLYSHDARRITQRDLDLAAAIDRILEAE
ncbi:MAG: 4a-hydroxytetrahydrobiopterin dehydratase [Myxococcota bacterium]